MATKIGLALLLFTAGCATSFTGDAHFPGGARSCYARCQADALPMAGFVHMGEYSTACVCGPPGPPAPAIASAAGTSAAAGAAAVGVVMQMRRQQQQQQAMR